MRPARHANMNIGFQEAVDSICREDTRYNQDAYAFIRDALEATLKRRKKTRKDSSAHATAAELLEGFRQHAIQEFGPMAITVLSYWGVRNAEDVGNLVFNLIEAGVFGKASEDTIESFRKGLDFKEAFVDPFQPSGETLSAGGVGTVERNA